MGHAGAGTPEERDAWAIRRRSSGSAICHLAELERKKWKINGLTLREEQIAHLAFALFSVCTSTRDGAAILLRNPPGTGKTIGLGVLNHAFMRWQERTAQAGGDPGVGAFCTAKPTHMAQQVFGHSQRVMRSPPYALAPRDVARYRKDLTTLYGDAVSQFFPKRGWDELFAAARTKPGDALVQEYLAASGDAADFARHGPAAAQAAALIAQLLDGSTRLVRGIYGTPDTIAPVPIPQGGEENTEAYGGDALPDFPQGYPVRTARDEWQAGEAAAAPRFVLGSSSMFTARQTREKMATCSGRRGSRLWMRPWG